jgi:DNA invertase Pin-like site-specific DNA recombinase
MSDKIKPHHVERKAILYVRQSSAYQVQNNLESQKLQYAMRDRLCSLGWREIEVVDEDLGRSASGAVIRAGFERMVAEVRLGHVGAVAAREVSRFARNSREWQKLVEVCRVVDTLLIDQEMVYTPRQSNDRLLLGLNRPETQSTPNSTFYWTTDPGVSGSERGFRLPKPSLRQIYPTC